MREQGTIRFGRLQYDSGKRCWHHWHSQKAVAAMTHRLVPVRTGTDCSERDVERYRWPSFLHPMQVSKHQLEFLLRQVAANDMEHGKQRSLSRPYVTIETQAK